MAELSSKLPLLYRAYSLIVASDDILPGLFPTCKKEADLQVRKISFPDVVPSPLQWFLHWYFPGGELWLSFAKIDRGYLLRFNELADFFVSRNGHKINCMPRPEIPSETIQHLLLDQVIPLVINLKGGEALHASAVLTPQGVIAFAGLTGSGKSTIAGSFLQAGYPLLSDDCVPLVEQNQDIYAIPAYPGLRLWEDALECLFGNNGNRKSVAHYTTKQRVCVEKKDGAYCNEPQPLKCVYTLGEPSEIQKRDNIVIEALSLRESIMELVKCTFRLDITDRDMLKRQLGFLKKVVSTVSVRRLIFPRNLQLLPAIREAIITDLKTF
jgi:hypothetical protein